MAEAAESSGGRGFPILVSLPPLPSPPAPAKLERKIEKYFQSKGESGGGECNVSGTGNPQIYRVSFVNKEDRENVLRRKEHSIQMNGSELRLSVKEEDGRREIQFNSSQTSLENMEAEAYSERGNEPPRVSQTVAPPGEEISPQWDSSREIFREVTAFLDPTLRGMLESAMKKNEIPSMRVKESSGLLGVTGSYSAIQQLYDYMRGQLMGQKGTTPPSFHVENRPPAQGEDTVSLSPALYRYFSEIYPDEVDKIKGKYKVELRADGESAENTVIRFIPTGPESNTERAKQSVTDAIQRITADWTQVTVTLRERNMSASEVGRRVRGHCGKTQTIMEGDTVTLRGPERELAQAKRLLEEGPTEPPAPHRVIPITSGNMSRDLSVSGSQWEILKELKANQIQEIEDKYDVTITASGNNGDKGKVQIRFCPRNGPPDLAPHACQIFLCLWHKTLSNIITRQIKVKPEFPETQLSSVQERLIQNQIEIISTWHNGSLDLIGSPGNIHAAEKLLGQWLNGGASGAEGEEPMDTSEGPSTEVRKEPGEEEDKCPICMCEPKPKLVLEKCKHVICAGCWEETKKHKPVCPVCNVPYGLVTGNQPEGTMTHSTSNMKLPGYRCGTITITYYFPNGVQGVST
uniref:E3 ubiquitin-protein ligase n=1 Tax=Xenopus tropicalis TaxID=8364 RepID=A0A1B8XX98_XENTR|eukprot:XP_002943711.2 PREDICTED: E3 ubiquitin-protein ligase DTX3L [Xenopus tropicalis]